MKYVLAFMKSFIFSFLLTYFAIDVWRLATGDLGYPGGMVGSFQKGI